VPIIFQARYLMATEEVYLLDGFLMIIDGSDELEEALPEDRIVASGPVT